MGLYDRVLSYIKNRHPGLLKLAEDELENNPVVVFNTISRKLNIAKACVLVCNDGYYRLFLSAGFSDNILSESISTSDFWDGTLPHQDWLHTSEEKNIPFLQFFSKDDVSDISRLHVKRFTVSGLDYVLLAAENRDSPELPLESFDSLLSSIINCINSHKG